MKRECVQPNLLTYPSDNSTNSIWINGTDHASAVATYGYHSPEMRNYALENDGFVRSQATFEGMEQYFTGTRTPLV